MSERTVPRVLTLFAFVGIAACSSDQLPTTPNTSILAGPAASATLGWQAQARSLVAANRLSPLAAGRIHAALGLAQHAAVLSVDESEFSQLERGGYGAGGRALFEARRGAVAGASAQVLAFFFPAAAAAIDQTLANMGDAGAGGVHPEYRRGVASGRAAADVVIERCRNDGFTRPWQGPAPTGPGIWIPGSLPPAGGTLGGVTPHFLNSGAQFRPAPPPAFGSAAFDAAVQEVVLVTQNRTPQELAIARLWDYAAGTPTPVGYWNSKASEYVVQNDLDDAAAARVFGLMHAAMFDALIGCWDAKYYYWTIRPYQASSAVALALGAPNHPSYPSGHSCVSSSAGRVLAHFFPDRAAELDALVTEAGLSRVYAGIHYLFDVTAGQQLGRAVADWALANSGM
ncbi:MAG TPA: vanadium-dependent haloperoxidase [Longimicrobiales bacterium]